MKIFEKYGGLEIVETIIENFYELANKNKNLNYYLKTQDIDSLKKHQKQLFKALLFEPLEYNGRELYEVHRLLNFAPALYDDVRSCLTQSMKLAGIESEDIDYILSNITSTEGLEKIVQDVHV